MKFLLPLITLFVSTFLQAQTTNNKHSLLEEARVKFIGRELNSCDTFKPNVNDKQAMERIDFLNKDFSTKLFDKYESVSYWYCETFNIDSQRMHLGLISISFNSEIEKDAAVKKIKSTKRANFKVKILTRFQLKESKCELLIVYSETVRNETVSAFLKEF